MDAWWTSLGLGLQIFYGIGLAATFAILIQVGLMVMGATHDGFNAVDVDADVHGGSADHGHGSGLKLLSFQAITAFLLGLGWMGAFMLSSTGLLILAIIVGLVTGIALMFAMAWLMAFLAQFQEEGNLDYKNAIGETGTVYIPIPGARTGRGQIEITFQGRHQVVEAMTSHTDVLAAHTKVLVVDLADGNTLVVRPI